ncbi:MAG: NAD(P)/FAD-dependent oxidoreductase [Bacteroidota bacterium]
MKKNYDFIIVGGGAAGFFAAITCAEYAPGARIAILERGKEVLNKVRISGGGRCNLTHACFDPRELVDHYPRGSKELLGPFHKFAPGDTIEWFESRGVITKIEEDGRMFPVTDSSQTIINCLMEAAKKNEVDILTQQNVAQIISPEDGQKLWGVRTRGNTVFHGSHLMMATGSQPHAWELLSHLGHTIVEPVPSLFTFNIKDKRITGLAGVSVPEADVQIVNERLKASGPLLITHWGLSGPGILRLSAWGARQLHQLGYQFELTINWVPQLGQDRLVEEFTQLRQKKGKSHISAHSKFNLPLRLWQHLVAAAGIPENTRWAEATKIQLDKLKEELHQGSYQVKGKSTFKEEFVTAGGVELKEIDFTHFRSKKCPGLYLAGEVLNIDAITGGFNFQAAWTGGWLVGKSIAEKISKG